MKGFFSRGVCAALLACVLFTSRAEAEASLEIYAGGTPFVDAPANTVPVNPKALALAPNGDLYVADEASGKILRFNPATSTVTSVPNLPGMLEYRFSGPHQALGVGPQPFILSLLAGQEIWQLLFGDGSTVYVGPMVAPMASAMFTPDGTLYYTRVSDHAVYRRTSSGSISLVAGGAVPGFTGDNSTIARFNNPRGTALDAAGNLYIADSSNNRVRRRAASTGVITTFAGTGVATYNGENLLARQTNLSRPTLLAFDAAGNLYIHEEGGLRIRKHNVATGRITNFAGNGIAGGDAGNGGPAINASINIVADMEIASNGTMYLAEADSYRVRKVDASGIISEVISNGTRSFCGEGVPAREACLNRPNGVAVDNAGDVYVSDQNNRRVRKISAATGLITTVAGGNDSAPVGDGDGGPALAARLPQGPAGIVVDAARNIYVAAGGRVRRIDAVTGIITAYAGTAAASGPQGDGGPAVAAKLNGVSRLALDSAGNLYIAEIYGHRVRRVDAATGIITTVAGTGSSTGALGDFGPAIHASLSSPHTLVFDHQDNLYIGDSAHYRIRKVSRETGVITTVAGNGTAVISGNGGPAEAAGIGTWTAFDVDSVGNIYLAAGFELRRIDVRTRIIDRVPAPIWGLYTPEGRSLENPNDMVLDGDDRLYITDAATNNLVLRASGLPPIGDMTQPVIEPIITGTPGTNGWYRSDVHVTWNITDPESEFTTSGCEESLVPIDTDAEGWSFTCSASSPGGTAHSTVVIKRDTVAPQLTFGTPSPAPDASGWNSTDVSVPFTATDAHSGVYSTSSGSPVTIEGAGSGLTATVVVTDFAGNSATFTTPAFNIDRLPPDVVPSVSGTLGSNGWYTSDVQVSWTVNAGASPITSSEGCDASAVTTDTAGVTFTCTATSGGGTNTQTVTIKRDATSPQLEFGAPSPAPNASGWFGGDVTFPYTAGDATSGVSSPGTVGSVVITGTGTGLTAQVTVTDGAGNSSTFTTPAVNIANTPPVITAQVSGTAGNAGWHRSDVQVAWITDAGALPITGSTGCETNNVTADSTGITFTCSATSAGGTSTESVTIKRDATAPMATFGAQTPAPDSRGWNNTHVSFPFSASDTLSGVASTSTSSPLIVSGNGVGLTGQVTVTDQAGNSANFTTVAVKIDNTVAVITPNIVGTLGTNGWYRSNVQVSWTIDELPGSVDWTSGCGTTNRTTDTTGVSYSCGVQSAGGYTSRTVSIKRDATAPVITITTPASNAVYTVGQSVTSSFGCTDARMQSCIGTNTNGAQLDTGTAGTRTFTVNALDLAGNTSTLVRTYTVQ